MRSLRKELKYSWIRAINTITCNGSMPLNGNARSGQICRRPVGLQSAWDIIEAKLCLSK